MPQFRISGRVFDWSGVPGSDGRLIDVRSGGFVLRLLLRGDERSGGRICCVAVIGSEFPPGEPATDPPFLLHGSESDRHGLIHTELIRSLVERCSRRKRYWRGPLNEHWRESFHLPKTEFPESQEERALREKAEAEKQARMAGLAAKDARFTDRRCPFCGQPCPEYRRTCKHCGRQVKLR